MLYNNLHKLIGLFLVLVIFSCHDNEEVTQIEDVIDPPKIVISTDHFCTLKDENGLDLVIKSAAFAGKTWQASVDGNLLVQGKQISKYNEPLEVTDQNGFSSKVFLSGKENDVNYQNLGIFTQYQNYSFISDQTNTISLVGDLKLELEENNYNIDGVSYSGEVVAKTLMTDMSNSNHINALPHVRIGKSTSGNLGYLNMLKTFYISIQSKNSQNLTANLNLIGNHLLDNGVQKLWFFDQDKAVWLEHQYKMVDGKAQFSHNKSGFYCTAEWLPGAYFSGYCHVGDLPLANLKLKFSNINSQFDINTSNKGNWTTYLPLNTEIIVEIQSTCGKIKDINFTTSNVTNFIDSEIKVSASDFVLINGNVKDCDGKDVSNCVLTDTQSGNTFFVEGNSFKFYLPSCDQENFSFIVSNQSGSEKGLEVTWENSSVIMTGTLLACDMAKGPYFNLIIEGKNKVYWDTKASIHQDGRMILQALDEQMNPVLSMYLPANGVGIRNDEMCNILLQEPSFLGKKVEVFCPTSTLGCGFDEIVITHFGDGADGYIRGHFKGRFWTKTFEPLSANYTEMSGEFQIKKEF
jgi:hypothetical protein